MPIDGVWYNELGATMTMQTNPLGVLTGTYETAVGSGTGRYVIFGVADLAGVESISLAFCVSWNGENGNNHSATAWSGQYQIVKGEETIATTWLLTSETAVGDDWESTLVGEDTFTRFRPGLDSARRRANHRATSHPDATRTNL